MQNETEKIHSPVLSEEWNFRNQIRLFLQLAITIASVLLCYLMTLPFLASLSWALALAVLFMPLHRKICRKIRKPTFSAIVTSAIAIIVLVIPVLLITIRVVLEIDRIHPYHEQSRIGRMATQSREISLYRKSPVMGGRPARYSFHYRQPDIISYHSGNLFFEIFPHTDCRYCSDFLSFVLFFKRPKRDIESHTAVLSVMWP